MEVNQGNEDEIEKVETVKVPNIEGISIKEAEKLIREYELEISIENDIEDLDKENTIIVEQTPKEGIDVNKNSKIYIKY